MLIRLSVRHLVLFAVFMPTVAIVFGVTWSVLFHFKATTFTHCRVLQWYPVQKPVDSKHGVLFKLKSPEFLPSISSAVDGRSPQRNVWRTCMALQTFPRFLLAWLYYCRYSQLHLGPQYNKCVKLCISLHFIENLALILLTYISSYESYGIHGSLFGIFILSSQMYMILTCVVYRWTSRCDKMKLTSTGKSLRYKRWSLRINILAFLTGGGMLSIHRLFCAPYAYSLFALSEYVIVASNIAFHATAALDFKHAKLVLWDGNVVDVKTDALDKHPSQPTLRNYLNSTFAGRQRECNSRVRIYDDCSVDCLEI